MFYFKGYNFIVFNDLFSDCKYKKINKNLMRTIFSSVLLIVAVICYLTNQANTTDLSTPIHQIRNEFNKYDLTKSTIPKHPSIKIPVYSVYLSDPSSDRYKQITQDKKVLLGEFIDYLYQITNFKYSMWLTKAIFKIFP